MATNGSKSGSLRVTFQGADNPPSHPSFQDLLPRWGPAGSWFVVDCSFSSNRVHLLGCNCPSQFHHRPLWSLFHLRKQKHEVHPKFDSASSEKKCLFSTLWWHYTGRAVRLSRLALTLNPCTWSIPAEDSEATFRHTIFTLVAPRSSLNRNEPRWIE